MAIEIRELVIRVRVEESEKKGISEVNTEKLKREILRECRRAIKTEFEKRNER